MKKTVRFLFVFLTIIFISCGQDRSGEYYALVRDRLWIEEKMREVYLWYEDIPEEKELKYLTTPESFFKTLLTKTGFNKKADNFSRFIPVDTENTRALYIRDYPTSYGMQCALYSSNTNNKHYYALVLYVIPGSPAAKEGIKRGDWIGKINEKEIDKNDEELLYTGGEVTFELNKIEINYKKKKATEGDEDEKKEDEEKEIESYEWVPLKDVTLPAADQTPQTPYITNTTITDPQIGKIGYMAYTNFDLKLDEENLYNDTYVKEMVEIFRKFKSDNVQNFILDLRYNPGGYLVCSHVLASLLAPEGKLGEIFCSVEHNDQLTSENQQLYLTTSITGGVNLNLKELYVITSAETASASEVLINCLSPYMDIITIGKTTVGKNVASKEYSNEEFPSFILSPIIAYIKNSNDEIKYEGIKPDFEAVEISVATDKMLELGDPEEKLLSTTIAVIKKDKLPETKEEEEKQALKAYSSKRRLNNLEGVILR